MSLTLYYGSGSPYAWRVWLALEHKQIPHDLKHLSFDAGDTRTPEFMALNPRHRVPVIVDGDFSLYESAAILEYLEDQYPSDAAARSLFPKHVRERARVRRLVREIDQYLAEGVEGLVGQLLFTPREKWDDKTIADALKIVRQECAHFERECRGDFLGDGLSAADFSLYPLLALALRIVKKKPNLDLASGIGPKLTAWMSRIEALPYFQKTYPPHWK